MLLGGRVLSGFICIEPAGDAADDALASWVKRGLDFVSGLPAKRHVWLPAATGHPGLVTSAGGIGSASAARPGAAGKGSAKYWVSCVTRSPVNSMTLTEYEGTPS